MNKLIPQEGYLLLQKPTNLGLFISFMNNTYYKFADEYPIDDPISYTCNKTKDKSIEYETVLVNNVRDFVFIHGSLITIIKMTPLPIKKISCEFLVIYEVDIKTMKRKSDVGYCRGSVKLDKIFEIKRDKNEIKRIEEIYKYIINSMETLNNYNTQKDKKIIAVHNIAFQVYF